MKVLLVSLPSITDNTNALTVPSFSTQPGGRAVSPLRLCHMIDGLTCDKRNFGNAPITN